MQARLPLDGMVQSQVDLIKINFLMDFENDLKAVVLRVLNLTLGNSSESAQFWEHLVRPQVYNDYGYAFPRNFMFEDLPVGSLVQACFHHFALNMKDKRYQLGVRAPFEAADVHSFNFRSKGFGYKSHKLRSIINAFSLHKDNKRFEAAEKLLEIKLLVEENLHREQDALDTMAELADVYLLQDRNNKALEISQKAIKKISVHSPT